MTRVTDVANGFLDKHFRFVNNLKLYSIYSFEHDFDKKINIELRGD